jgi:hypothetical protein
VLPVPDAGDAGGPTERNGCDGFDRLNTLQRPDGEHGEHGEHFGGSGAKEDGALDVITIAPWVDPVIDTVGHDPRSAYVERFWLSVLGPSTVWLLRRVAAEFDEHPEGFPLDLHDTAAALGLAAKDRRVGRSPVMKALQRSATFGASRVVAPGQFQVRRKLPPLTRRQVERLPASVQHEHRRWIANDARRPLAAEMRQRARHLALSLVELGESYDDAERQLHRWKFHPAVAHDAVKWAHAEHHARATGGFPIPSGPQTTAGPAESPTTSPGGDAA